MSEFLNVKNVSKSFYYSHFIKRTYFKAVDDVSFSLDEGETLAVLGQNGSGKSTLAKLLVGMLEPESGSISIEDQQLKSVNLKQRSTLIKMVFQSTSNSFNPSFTVGQILNWPLIVNTQLNKKERQELILNVLKSVGLSAEHIQYYPNQMAVGQKQRVSIARALILQPKVIIFDESFTALDISIRSQIINLMLQLQKKHKLSYIYISQDIGLLKHISDKIIVMHDGKIVEAGNTLDVIENPTADVTQKLVKSYFD